MFCTLTVGGKLIESCIRSFIQWLLSGVCFLLCAMHRTKSGPSLKGEDNIKEGRSSIQEIMTAQDKSLGNIAGGVAGEGEFA